MQMQSSVIKIMRKKKWGDSFRFYEIILDGKNVGIIFASQSISVPVESGDHSLKINIDWGGSEEINFSIGSGEEITFECESSLSILKVLLIPYYLIFRPNNWVSLKQC
ncbi:MAG: hypothetical protein V7K89_04315 [Nostoc sp.]|uniref:hypothetical protein n=1 Tax=Nostoc sp. TaxID=1180 RepID=UPI002FF6AAE2